MSADYQAYSPYQGGTADGLRDGRGRCTFANKFFSYDGEWYKGAMHGNGTLCLADGSEYTGSFQQGEMTGVGLRRWASGATYSGDFVGGEMHGKGTLVASDGSQYTGSFQQNCREGPGLHISAAGDRYEGTWHANARDGVGTLCTVADGSVYRGEWSQGVREGEGETEWARAIYRGTFKADLPDGAGEYRSPGSYCYCGSFAAGVPLAPATHIVAAPFTEAPMLLAVGVLRAAACAALAEAEGELSIFCELLTPRGVDEQRAAASGSTAVSAPPGESTDAAWVEGLRVELPAGTRQPPSFRFTLRLGEKEAVASGELHITNPALEGVEASVDLVREGGPADDVIALTFSYTLAAVAEPQEEGAGEPHGEGEDGPATLGVLRAAAGQALPALELRCLQVAARQEEQPPFSEATGEEVEAAHDAVHDDRALPAPEEWGRTLGVALEAAPADDDAAEPQFWPIGSVLSPELGGPVVARLRVPEDAPAGRHKLLIRDETPRLVLERLSLAPLIGCEAEVEVL